MRNRRSLTPATGVPVVDGARAMRRGGPRHELTERVNLLGPNFKTRDGWALNVSRGGVRVILEEPVELGEEYGVTVGADEAHPLSRRARVVWVQQEPDGFVVGLEFIAASGEHGSVELPGPEPAPERTGSEPPKAGG